MASDTLGVAKRRRMTWLTSLLDLVISLLRKMSSNSYEESSIQTSLNCEYIRNIISKLKYLYCLRLTHIREFNIISMPIDSHINTKI